MKCFYRYPETIFSKFISIEGNLYPSSQTNDGQPDLLVAETEMANRLGEGAIVDADVFLSATTVNYDSYTPFKELTRNLFGRNYRSLNLRTEITDDPGVYGGYGYYTGLGIWQNFNNRIYAAYQVENEDIYVGEEVFFNFAGSEGNRSQVNYFWDFNDGTNSSERSPSHIYTLAGQYKVNLTISDEFNITSSFVLPGNVRILPGSRPVEVGETSINMQNTESYKTKENNVDDVEFQKPWLVILPILAIIKKRRHNTEINKIQN
ncbi:MAG: PKD domain-containing protein [Candidatus Heimdallarchaeota archaeon]|nr:PKD domain-containing protein [Candidatus Heimdallarchaeota archaeon]